MWQQRCAVRYGAAVPIAAAIPRAEVTKAAVPVEAPIPTLAEEVAKYKGQKRNSGASRWTEF